MRLRKKRRTALKATCFAKARRAAAIQFEGNIMGSFTPAKEKTAMALDDGRHTILTQPWVSSKSKYPPRLGNVVQPLVNGEDAFGAIHDAIYNAQKSIDIITWGFDPGMRLKRPDGPRYGELLAKKAKDDKVQVRVLVWRGVFPALDQAAGDGLGGSGGGSGGLGSGSGHTSAGTSGSGATLPDGSDPQARAFNRDWFASTKGNPYMSFHRRGFGVGARAHIAGQQIKQGHLLLGAVQAFAPSHHQKMVLVDYELPEVAVGFVMGHNSENEYWDRSQHAYDDPLRLGLGPFQDLSARVRGGVLFDLNENFSTAWSQSQPWFGSHQPIPASRSKWTPKDYEPAAVAQAQANAMAQLQAQAKTQPEEVQAQEQEQVKKLEQQAQQAQEKAQQAQEQAQQAQANAQQAKAQTGQAYQTYHQAQQAWDQAQQAQQPPWQIQAAQLETAQQAKVWALTKGKENQAQEQALQAQMKANQARKQAQQAREQAQQAQKEPRKALAQAKAKTCMAQICRTQPEEKEASILDLYKTALSNARNYVYFENQYFRHKDLVMHLREMRKKLKAAGWKKDFYIFVVTNVPEITARDETYKTLDALGKGDLMPTIKKDNDTPIVMAEGSLIDPVELNKAEDDLRKKDLEGVNIHICTLCASAEMQTKPAKFVSSGVGPMGFPTGSIAPHQSTVLYKPIYVHAKLLLVDDVFFTLGSANVNVRSMETDSEINIGVPSPEVTREWRQRLWGLHTGRAPGDDMKTEFRRWTNLMKTNAQAMKNKELLEASLIEFHDDSSSKSILSSVD
jgi:phosphatidylserine/phosphatidylglycerophosphate/cardiolipin synthase-like enzyme